MSKHFFTSESVTEGHPDKLCDQIADAVLDDILKQDPEAHVACEVTATTGLIYVMGEITTNCYVDIAEIARKTVKSVGYDNHEFGFDGNTCGVMVSIHSQSKDIAMGVHESLEVKEGNDSANSQLGAGDQGLMFGFACDETPEFMPLPISLANQLAKKLAEVRKEKILNYLRPDGKTQVTVEYENEKPVRVDAVVVSAQHAEGVSQEKIKADITEYVIKSVIHEKMLDANTKIFVNPTGRFVIGGPVGDSGLTGRKIIVDTYGGYARHGGGAFSGKDPTKVDRTGAYAARHIAKNIVGAGLSKKCEVQLAYAIGKANPVSVMINTFGTSKVGDETLTKAVNEVFDLRPSALIDEFELRNPIYLKLASYGHMGRENLDVKWENLNKTEQLKQVVNDIVG